MQKITCLFFALIACSICRANGEDSLTAGLYQYNKLVDSVNKAMKYETGQVTLSNGIAQLAVPQGFKFLNAGQSNYILTELWGNPPQPDMIGMLFPDNGGPFADSTYAFVITYKAMGYVKDEDADKIDYDQMLNNLQKEEAEENTERQKMGYPAIHIVGWAQKPYYDKANKVLHWAKELKFGGTDVRTLNYDIVILGRKGILSMNAVGNMSQLDLVKKDIHKVLNIAAFSAGNRHEDFDPKLDEVAAWTIGSLVAGKVLAKVGAFAFLAKFLKFIVIGLAAAGAWVARVFKRKRPSAQLAYETVPPPPGGNEPIV
jgi:uncharacterized membrane-anchored protein